MKEIGGYIELDTYTGSMLHDSAIKLNCGRNCLAYLIRVRKIKRLVLPYFLCDSVHDVCCREHVAVRYYHIGPDFLPESLRLEPEEWLYFVNYYSQICNKTMQKYKTQYPRLIVDNAQAYFAEPLPHTDTIYTCRKFFGVADGSVLYTTAQLDDKLPRDESYNRMRFLMGRYERPAHEFYQEYIANNHFFEKEPLKLMSRLTNNLLHGIDYELVRQKRTENFVFLHHKLGEMNKLRLRIPEGAFMYPLYVQNGVETRKKLLAQSVYIPTLWPNVLEHCEEKMLEYDMAGNILPLPCDQRYGREDMEYLVKVVRRCVG